MPTITTHIQDKIKFLKQKENQLRSERETFCFELIDKFNPTKKESILDITVSEWLLFHLQFENPEIPFYQLKEKMESVQSELDSLDLTSCIELIQLLKNAEIIKKNSKSFKIELENLFNGSSPTIVNFLLELNYSNTLRWWEMFATCQEMRRMFLDEMSQHNLNGKLKKQIERKFFSDSVEEDIILFFSNFQSQKLQLEKEKKREQKRIRKELKAYEKILEQYNNGMLTGLEQELNEIDQTIAITLILELIQNQNTEKERLTDEIKKLEQAADTIEFILQSFLEKSDKLDNHKSQIDYLKERKTTEEIQQIIEFWEANFFSLKKLSITEIMNLLTYLSMDKCKRLTSLWITQAIDIEFLKTILLNLSEQENIIDILLENFNQLTDNKIDFRDDIYHPTILTLNPEELKKRINLLKNYPLEYNSQSVYLNLLEKPFLLDFIDFLIEQELPTEIAYFMTEDNIQIEEIKKRILIAKSFALPIIDNDNNLLPSIRNGANFPIPTPSLNQFIINKTEYEEEETVKQILEQSDRLEIDHKVTKPLLKSYIDYLSEEEYFQFDQTSISKNKLLRNLTILLSQQENLNLDEKELFFQAAIHNTILSDLEIEQLKQAILVKKEKTIS